MADKEDYLSKFLGKKVKIFTAGIPLDADETNRGRGVNFHSGLLKAVTPDYLVLTWGTDKNPETNLVFIKRDIILKIQVFLRKRSLED